MTDVNQIDDRMSIPWHARDIETVFSDSASQPEGLAGAEASSVC